MRILPCPDSIRVEAEAGTYPTVHRDGEKGLAPQAFDRPQVTTEQRTVARLKRIGAAMREFGLTEQAVQPAMVVLSAHKGKQRQEALRGEELVELALQSLAAPRQQLKEERLR